jgi:hypothetical protein
MKFLLEYKCFYNVGDIVLIEYWYKDIIVPVKILEKKGGYYKVTHNIPSSKLFNAPDEKIKTSDIIDHYRLT